jgi:nucleoid-associated protein EbfC
MVWSLQRCATWVVKLWMSDNGGFMAKGFKAQKMGKQAGMLGQMQKLQEQLQQAQDQLAQELVEYTAGGGAVKVVMTGDQHCQSIEIDPDLLKENDVEMVQDLLLAAVNGSLDASRQLAMQRLGPLSSGLPF